VDMKDGDKKGRVVVPNGQITETGDTQFVHSDATGSEVTLEATPDESGNKAYSYWDDGSSEVSPHLPGNCLPAPAYPRSGPRRGRVQHTLGLLRSHERGRCYGF